MSNLLFIRKISDNHELDLSDAEIRIISFRYSKINNKKIVNQVGGSIKKCMSIKKLLEIGNKDVVKQLMNKLLNNELKGIEFICHKFIE